MDHGKLEVAMRAAVTSAIERIGIADFKKCSFFISNYR